MIVTIETDKYIRKPLYVNAVRVTEENFDSASIWSEGTVETESGGPREGQKFIKVNVHGVPKSQRQTKAFVGDWLLHTERGFKVYTDNAFRASFNLVEPESPAKVTTPDNGVPVSPGTVPRPHVAPITPPEGVEATLERAPVVSASDSAPPQKTADGRRVLTIAEQKLMGADEVTDLIRSGQAVLQQDVQEVV